MSTSVSLKEEAETITRPPYCMYKLYNLICLALYLLYTLWGLLYNHGGLLQKKKTSVCNCSSAVSLTLHYKVVPPFTTKLWPLPHLYRRNLNLTWWSVCARQQLCLLESFCCSPELLSHISSLQNPEKPIRKLSTTADCPCQVCHTCWTHSNNLGEGHQQRAHEEEDKDEDCP